MCGCGARNRSAGFVGTYLHTAFLCRPWCSGCSALSARRRRKEEEEHTTWLHGKPYEATIMIKGHVARAGMHRSLWIASSLDAPESFTKKMGILGTRTPIHIQQISNPHRQHRYNTKVEVRFSSLVRTRNIALHELAISQPAIMQARENFNSWDLHFVTP